MFVPHGSISTPTERLLPSSVASNEYVRALVHPAFAEVQQPYGSPRAFYRPSAPFPYTNSWGCNMALLVPLLIAMLVEVRSPRVRIALGAALLAAAVPAAASLNRGMFIGLGVGTAYIAVRLAIRGRVVPLAAVVGSVGVAAVGAVATGVFADLQQRLSYSHTNTGRLAIYRESFDGALSSPLLGNGAPRASETVDVAVGTQGEIWNVMFSFGFVALLWFVGWFVAAWWLSRRAPSVADLWISAVLVVAIATFFFYGYDGPQLAVVMTAAALAVRDRTGARAIRPTTASTRQMLRPVIG
jgi:O-antigen ligase